MTEFRFPPLSLTDPTGVDPVLERAPARASCCGNCDQGLPCASTADERSAGHPRQGEECPSPGTGKCQPKNQAPSKGLLPLGSEAPQRSDAMQAFWQPMDVESRLVPILRCNRTPPLQPGSSPNPDSWAQGKVCEDLSDDGTDIVPRSHCGPIPPELDDWDPCPNNRDVFCDTNSYRCSLTSCNDAVTSCAPIQAGMFSQLSRAQPVFSYSRWKGGYLEEKDTPAGEPPYGLADCSLMRAIAYHIDTTRKGDEVFIAIPAWSDVAWVIVQSVTAAKQRGVSVKVIGGGGNWAVLGGWTKSQLDKALGPTHLKMWESNYYSFSFGDLPSQISHNKFVLIWKKASNQHLVLITSANWARFDIARNCDLLVVDNEKIWGSSENTGCHCGGRTRISPFCPTSLRLRTSILKDKGLPLNFGLV